MLSLFRYVALLDFVPLKLCRSFVLSLYGTDPIQPGLAKRERKDIPDGGPSGGEGSSLDHSGLNLWTNMNLQPK